MHCVWFLNPSKKRKSHRERKSKKKKEKKRLQSPLESRKEGLHTELGVLFLVRHSLMVSQIPADIKG